MKRIIFYVFLIMCCVYAQADDKNEQQGQAIQIYQMENDMKASRSIIECIATWYPNLHRLEFEIYGVGDGEISIIDSDGNVLEYTSIFAGTIHTTIFTPDSAGAYSILICCDNYYGMGQFIVK